VSANNCQITEAVKLCYLYDIFMKLSYLFNINYIHYKVVEWADLNHAVVERAVGEWCQRLRACVRAGGGHFQHMM